MSLYDDIIDLDDDKSTNDAKNKTWLTNSSNSLNLLQHHLQNKSRQSKPSNQFKPRQTVFSLSTKPKPSITTSQPTFTPAKYAGSLLGGEWNVSLEYDPFWPNDYEKIIKERKIQINNQPQLQTTSIKTNTFTASSINTPVLSLGARPLVDAYSDEDDDEDSKKSQLGAAIAPPPSLIESSGTSPLSSFNSMSASNQMVESINPSLNMKVSNVAAKIMARMGYKEGKGLGKNQQGIATALQVEKTSKNSGIIIADSTSSVTTLNKEEFTMPQTPQLIQSSNNQSNNSSNQPQESITEIMKNPTKVIMLRNMVGQGEVDPDLEPEVKDECGKFGEVVSCVIYEVNEGLINGKRLPNVKNMTVPDDQAVRIFVEFSRVESAIKAIIDLNGRYFGGRTVKGSFYDLEKFKKLELSN